MIKIDNSLLQDVGLAGLPDAEKNSFLKHIYETLEMRVGIRLADQMSNEQLDEFERYFEAKDDAGAFKWLETNFPNYKDIVQEEFDKLKAEVAQSAPQILSASQQAAAVAPPAQPSAIPPQYQQTATPGALQTDPPALVQPPFEQGQSPQQPAAATYPDPAAAPPAPAQPYAAPPAASPASNSDTTTPPVAPFSQQPPTPVQPDPADSMSPPQQPPAGPGA